MFDWSWWKVSRPSLGGGRGKPRLDRFLPGIRLLRRRWQATALQDVLGGARLEAFQCYAWVGVRSRQSGDWRSQELLWLWLLLRRVLLGLLRLLLEWVAGRRGLVGILWHGVVAALAAEGAGGSLA
jgi:hypothetical protein